MTNITKKTVQFEFMCCIFDITIKTHNAMRTQFLTKYELCCIIARQFDMEEPYKTKVAERLVRLDIGDILKQTEKAGFKVEVFGYNRFFIQ